MGAVTLTATQNEKAFADFADPNTLFTFDPVSLEVIIPSLTQSAIDTALVNYAANQSDIDDDFADKRADEKKDRDKDAFDEKNDLTALIKEMVEQLNVLRALHALPPLNFGTVNADIRNKIE